MTMAGKRGVMNVLDALRCTIVAQLPALVSSYNAATSLDMLSYLDGPYTIVDPIILAINNGADVTVSVAPGAYTVDALAIALNALPTFSTTLGMTAETEIGKLHLYRTVRGISGNVRLTSGGSPFGWQDGRGWAYEPLRNLAQFEPGYPNVEPVAYPALRLWCTRDEMNADHLESTYTVAMRLYESDVTASWGEILYRNLGELARLVEDVLVNVSNANLGGRVTDVRLLSIAPGVQLEQGGAAMWRGSVDLACRVLVQENI
jgi:hypothetical protein